jgi:N-acetylmuramoyl-L-alanine amidase
LAAASALAGSTAIKNKDKTGNNNNKKDFSRKQFSSRQIKSPYKKLSPPGEHFYAVQIDCQKKPEKKVEKYIVLGTYSIHSPSKKQVVFNRNFSGVCNMRLKCRVGKYLTGLLIILLGLGISPVMVLAAQQAAIKGSSVNVRSGPGTNYKISGSALRGDNFEVAGKSGDWYQIKLPGGSTGWIAASLLSVSGSAAGQAVSNASTAPAAIGQAVVKGTTLNLRSGPGTSYKQTGRLSQGAVLQVLEKSGDWYRVKTSAGATGWVAAWLVAVNKSSAPAAVTPAAAPSSSAAAGGWKAVVTGSVVNVRSGPGTNNKTTGSVSRGTSLQVLEKSADWYRVQTSSGTGWVSGGLLKVTGAPVQASPAPAAPTVNPVTVQSGNLAVINGNNVNIRSGPGTIYDVVSRASLGDRLPLVEQSAEWYKVKMPGGYYGWVVASLVKVDESEQLAPVVDDKLPADSPGGNVEGGVIPPAKNDTITQPPSSEQEEIPDSGIGTIQPGEETTAPEDQSSTENQSNPDLSLKSFMIKEDGRKTGVTVESAVPISSVSAFTLKNPARLVVDLEGVQPGSLPESVEAGTELVGQARVGWFNHNPDTVRLVFDLNETCYHSTRLSADKRTLLVELTPPGPGRSLAGSTIVLDPGHGGKDPGAIGPTGLQEKTVTLDVALRVAEYLRQKGANVVLTREDDTFVDLYDRPAVATSAGASVFVSIHMNANVSRSIDGTSTYYVRTPPSGSDRLKTEGYSLAKKLQSRVQGGLGTRNIGVLEADFVVLKASEVPAALVEVAFISNTNEESFMKTDGFKENTARYIAEGIADYYGE